MLYMLYLFCDLFTHTVAIGFLIRHLWSLRATRLAQERRLQPSAIKRDPGEPGVLEVIADCLLACNPNGRTFLLCADLPWHYLAGGLPGDKWMIQSNPTILPCTLLLCAGGAHGVVARLNLSDPDSLDKLAYWSHGLGLNFDQQKVAKP